MQNTKHSLSYRVTSCFVAIVFTLTTLLPPGQSYAQGIALPTPGTMVTVSPAYLPPIIKGITIHPENPLLFDFIVHPGDDNLEGQQLKEESTKLIKYFMASLTVPEDQMWVNLSPYEKDRIVPESLGQTEMGRDLLAQDYLLKQLTASLMYPEDELGSEFWDRVYQKAYEKYGTSEIPMNTFNKVWIMPDTASIYENGTSVFVVDSHLKVMLEEDYLAMEHNAVVGTRQRCVHEKDCGITRAHRWRAPTYDNSQTEIIREIIIPAIEKEVNEGKTFANLRQIYNSVILATWYKQNLKESLLGQVYVDQNKTKGIDIEDKQIKEKIYKQYLEAFKVGVYDYIREDYDPKTQVTIPRKYFSGGVAISSPILNVNKQPGLFFDKGHKVRAKLGAIGNASSPVGARRGEGKNIWPKQFEGSVDEAHRMLEGRGIPPNIEEKAAKLLATDIWRIITKNSDFIEDIYERISRRFMIKDRDLHGSVRIRHRQLSIVDLDHRPMDNVGEIINHVKRQGAVLLQAYYNMEELVFLPQNIPKISVSSASRDGTMERGDNASSPVGGMTVFETPHGVKYKALFAIGDNKTDLETLGVSYSYLKFGRRKEIGEFSQTLAQRIMEEIGEESINDQGNWVVVVPGGVEIPSAAALFSREVAEKLNLPHVMLKAPKKDLKRRISGRGFQSEDWRLTLETILEADQGFELRDKKIIFIDDGVATGSILELYHDYFSQIGVLRMEPFVLARLLGTDDIEKTIDSQILQRFGLASLIEILNDERSIYTTRTIFHSFQMDETGFKQFVGKINQKARLNLYLYSLQYLGTESSSLLDILVEAIENDLGVKFPGFNEMKEGSSLDLFAKVIQALKGYEYRVPLQAAEAMAKKIWSWLDDETDVALVARQGDEAASSPVGGKVLATLNIKQSDTLNMREQESIGVKILKPNDGFEGEFAISFEENGEAFRFEVTTEVTTEKWKSSYWIRKPLFSFGQFLYGANVQKLDGKQIIMFGGAIPGWKFTPLILFERRANTPDELEIINVGAIHGLKITDESMMEEDESADRNGVSSPVRAVTSFTKIMRKVRPSTMTPRQVEYEFRKLVDDGVEIKPAGEAKDDPLSLLSRGYTPKYKVQLFDTTYYLTNLRLDEDEKIFVAYVLQKDSKTGKFVIYPRLFYKDYSLVWRSASHYHGSKDHTEWFGKGDLTLVRENGKEFLYAKEETTNLPLEIQSALDTISQRVPRPQRDEIAVHLILRRAPNHRIEPYRDFTKPRQKANANRKNRINKGRRIAYFTRKNDPTSLKFVDGFEPDFQRGIIEIVSDDGPLTELYGGEVRKYRILSRNQQVQYQFVAAPNVVWLNPAQTVTTEIMSYGVRTMDVIADRNTFVPGVDYFEQDGSHDPPRVESQIPVPGIYAGEISAVLVNLADASRWLNKVPVIQKFKRKVLARNIRKPNFVPLEKDIRTKIKPIINRVADMVIDHYRKAKALDEQNVPYFVLDGQAASGKTTAVEELALQLREREFHPVHLNLDIFLKSSKARDELMRRIERNRGDDDFVLEDLFDLDAVDDVFDQINRFINSGEQRRVLNVPRQEPIILTRNVILLIDGLIGQTEFLQKYYNGQILLSGRIKQDPKETRAQLEQRSRDKNFSEEKIATILAFYDYGLIPAYDSYSQDTRSSVDFIVNFNRDPSTAIQFAGPTQSTDTARREDESAAKNGASSPVEAMGEDESKMVNVKTELLRILGLNDRLEGRYTLEADDDIRWSAKKFVTFWLAIQREIMGNALYHPFDGHIMIKLEKKGDGFIFSVTNSEGIDWYALREKAIGFAKSDLLVRVNGEIYVNNNPKRDMTGKGPLVPEEEVKGMKREGLLFIRGLSVKEGQFLWVGEGHGLNDARKFAQEVGGHIKIESGESYTTVSFVTDAVEGKGKSAGSTDASSPVAAGVQMVESSVKLPLVDKNRIDLRLLQLYEKLSLEEKRSDEPLSDNFNAVGEILEIVVKATRQRFLDEGLVALAMNHDKDSVLYRQHRYRNYYKNHLGANQNHMDPVILDILKLEEFDRLVEFVLTEDRVPGASKMIRSKEDSQAIVQYVQNAQLVEVKNSQKYIEEMIEGEISNVEGLGALIQYWVSRSPELIGRDAMDTMVQYIEEAISNRNDPSKSKIDKRNERAKRAIALIRKFMEQSIDASLNPEIVSRFIDAVSQYSVYIDPTFLHMPFSILFVKNISARIGRQLVQDAGMQQSLQRHIVALGLFDHEHRKGTLRAAINAANVILGNFQTQYPEELGDIFSSAALQIIDLIDESSESGRSADDAAARRRDWKGDRGDESPDPAEPWRAESSEKKYQKIKWIRDMLTDSNIFFREFDGRLPFNMGALNKKLLAARIQHVQTTDRKEIYQISLEREGDYESVSFAFILYRHRKEKSAFEDDPNSASSFFQNERVSVDLNGFIPSLWKSIFINSLLFSQQSHQDKLRKEGYIGMAVGEWPEGKSVREYLSDTPPHRLDDSTAKLASRIVSFFTQIWNNRRYTVSTVPSDFVVELDGLLGIDIKRLKLRDIRDWRRDQSAYEFFRVLWREVGNQLFLSEDYRDDFLGKDTTAEQRTERAIQLLTELFINASNELNMSLDTLHNELKDKKIEIGALPEFRKFFESVKGALRLSVEGHRRIQDSATEGEGDRGADAASSPVTGMTGGRQGATEHRTELQWESGEDFVIHKWIHHHDRRWRRPVRWQLDIVEGKGTIVIRLQEETRNRDEYRTKKEVILRQGGIYIKRVFHVIGSSGKFDRYSDVIEYYVSEALYQALVDAKLVSIVMKDNRDGPADKKPREILFKPESKIPTDLELAGGKSAGSTDASSPVAGVTDGDPGRLNQHRHFIEEKIALVRALDFQSQKYPSPSSITGDGNDDIAAVLAGEKPAAYVYAKDDATKILLDEALRRGFTVKELLTSSGDMTYVVGIEENVKKIVEMKEDLINGLIFMDDEFHKRLGLLLGYSNQAVVDRIASRGVDKHKPRGAERELVKLGYRFRGVMFQQVRYPLRERVHLHVWVKGDKLIAVDTETHWDLYQGPVSIPWQADQVKEIYLEELQSEAVTGDDSAESDAASSPVAEEEENPFKKEAQIAWRQPGDPRQVPLSFYPEDFRSRHHGQIERIVRKWNTNIGGNISAVEVMEFMQHFIYTDYFMRHYQGNISSVLNRLEEGGDLVLFNMFLYPSERLKLYEKPGTYSDALRLLAELDDFQRALDNVVARKRLSGDTTIKIVIPGVSLGQEAILWSWFIEKSKQRHVDLDRFDIQIIGFDHNEKMVRVANQKIKEGFDIVDMYGKTGRGQYTGYVQEIYNMLKSSKQLAARVEIHQAKLPSDKANSLMQGVDIISVHHIYELSGDGKNALNVYFEENPEVEFVSNHLNLVESAMAARKADNAAEAGDKSAGKPDASSLVGEKAGGIRPADVELLAQDREAFIRKFEKMGYQVLLLDIQELIQEAKHSGGTPSEYLIREKIRPKISPIAQAVGISDEYFRYMLYRPVEEFVKNIVRHSKTKLPGVILVRRTEDKLSVQLEITVQDFGIGIEDIESSMKKSPEATGDYWGGRGEGLSSSIDIIVNTTRFKGTVIVESKGKQVTFNSRHGSLDYVIPGKSTVNVGTKITFAIQRDKVVADDSSKEAIGGDDSVGTDTVSSPVTAQNPGGIDLNPEMIEMNKRGNGVPYQFPAIDLQHLQNINIEGFLPVIINISPITDIPLLLGIADTKEESTDLGYESLDPLEKRDRFKVEKSEQLSFLN